MRKRHPLRTFRVLNDMTQAQLAEAVGCDRSTIAGIETCLRDPSADLVRRICEATGLDANAVLWRPESELQELMQEQ